MVHAKTSSCRIGVVGVGSFGARHAARYSELAEADLAVVCDVDAERARSTAAQLGVGWTTDYRDLIGSVDAVSIAVPTNLHFEVSRHFLERGVHVLVEKPICDSLADADALIELAAARQLVLQVGHLERFNPVVEAMLSMVDRPKRIDARRISTNRSSDKRTNVTLDLMIHDLDLVFQLFPGAVRSIRATTDPLIGDADSHVSAHIEFGDGCVANIVASWVGTAAERTMSIIQPDSTVVADLKNTRLSLLRASPQGGEANGDVAGKTTSFASNTSLERQLRSFVRAVRHAEMPVVTGLDGRRALEAALAVIAGLEAGSGSDESFRAA